VAPIKAAMNLNMPYDLIFNSLLAAIAFRATNEQGEYLPADMDFFSESLQGIQHILKDICSLDLSL
jgi:mannitol-1-phosphate 5-dehydrogenase